MSNNTSPTSSERLWRRRCRRWLQWLNERLALVLMPVLVLGTGLLLWHLYRQVSAQYQELALQGAVLQAQTIEPVRQVYAGEVVERLRGLGIEATHDYIDKPGTVPLPATLTMEIGERLGKDRPSREHEHSDHNGNTFTHVMGSVDRSFRVIETQEHRSATLCPQRA